MRWLGFRAGSGTRLWHPRRDENVLIKDFGLGMLVILGLY